MRAVAPAPQRLALETLSVAQSRRTRRAIAVLVATFNEVGRAASTLAQQFVTAMEQVNAQVAEQQRKRAARSQFANRGRTR